MPRRLGTATIWAVAIALAASALILPACGAKGGGAESGGTEPFANPAEPVMPGGTVDRAIKVTIETNLRADPRTQTSSIVVSVSGGTVTLSGTANGPDAKSAALELARKVQGTKGVVDNITVGPGSAPGAPGVPAVPEVPAYP